MRLNTKTRYATRALLELAVHEHEGARSLQQIAASQGLSFKYLETLFSSLRSAGLVQSLRGPQGGYLLARPSDLISLRDVYEVFEGHESLVACVSRPDLCVRASDCVAREVWCDLTQQTMRSLEGVTLARLAERVWERAQARAPDYAI